MDNTYYLCVFNFAGEREYHLYKSYDKAKEAFKELVDNSIEYTNKHYRDDNGHSYNDIIQEEYFRDGEISARIETLECYDG